MPRYIPKMEVVDYQGTGIYLIYLWCTAGDSGPYQAPKTVYVESGKRIDKSLKYWIRPGPLTVEAKQDEVAELFDKFNSLQYLDSNGTFNSVVASKLLNTEIKTASRLLAKAEKIKILSSEGKTKNKVYMRGQAL